MEGTILFETNSSVHPTSFGHPPLKLANSPSDSFSRTDWSSHRALWSRNQNNSSAQNDQSHPRSQQATNFHSDIRAGTLSRPAFVPTTTSIKGSEAPVLSPIDNPKGPSRPTLDPWSTSVGASTLTAQQANMPSPSKYRSRGWSFEDDLGFPSENSTLLQDSAPDIDIVDDPQLDRYGVTKDSAVGIRGAVNNRFESDVRNRRILQPTRNSASHTGPFTNNNLQTSLINGARSRAPEPTPYPRFDSSSMPGSVQQYQSSTSKEISENSLRFLSNQQNGSSMIDKTADAMAAVTLNTPAVSSRASYSENDPFRTQDRGLDVTSRNKVSSRSMLCVEGADFQPMGMSVLYDINVPDNLYGSGNFSSLWYSERSTPSLSNDFFVNGNGRVHSTAMTPPTAQYSAQSRGDSGISSRTSHHDFSLVDRKLLNGDTYQHSPAHADSSFVSGMVTPYDTSIISGNRMNPLAGTYMPYPMTNHHTTGNGSYSPNSRMPSRETEPQNPRSALLEEFRINAKTNKRYELRDIFNHVVEFSGDQHGSRFIQQKLETANSDEKDQIFTEIQTNCLQLMTDVFGNYVIQKLFEHGNQTQKKTLANHMKGHVLYLSTQMYGCRVVQKALEHVLTDQQASMVNELDGPNKQILKVIRDQNGNHVVQKAIERVPATHIKFIIEAHKGEVVKLATHTYGCRVIQRILEHCEADVKRIILDELHGCVAPLITDSFGNYVVQHIIEKGEAQDRRVVISIVQQNILHFSKHKFASNVVEKCIAHADSDQRKELVQGLTATNAQGTTPVLGLLRDQYGNYVIQKVHGMLTGAELDALVHDMKICLPQLKRTSYGKQVMAIEKLLYGANNSLSITTLPHSQQMMPGSTHNDHRTAQFGPHPSSFNNTTYNFSPLANYTSH